MDEQKFKLRIRELEGESSWERFGDRIKRLRGDKTLAEFADLIGVGKTTVSEWEMGNNNPEGESWAAMANLAPYPENIWFWRQAGVDIQAVLSATEKLLKEQGAPEADFVDIPYLGESFEESRDAGRLHSFPKWHVSGIASARYWVADKNAATLTIFPSEIVLLDISHSSATDWSPFVGQVVFGKIHTSRGVIHMQGAHKGKADHNPDTWFVGRIRCEIVRDKLAIERRLRPQILMWHLLLDVFGDSDTDVEGLKGEIILDRSVRPFPESLDYPKGLEEFEAKNRKLVASKMRIAPIHRVLGLVKGWFPRER